MGYKIYAVETVYRSDEIKANIEEISVRLPAAETAEGRGKHQSAYAGEIADRTEDIQKG